MNKLLFKDTLRTVRNHFSRYLSIMLIVALGTAFFVGIKATSPDMLSNAENYFSDYNLADLRIQSSIGFTQNDVSTLRTVNGVDYVSGTKFTDAFVYVNGKAELDIDGTFISTRAYSISPNDIANYNNGVNDGAYMNRVQLLKGRYPEHANECLVDESRLSTPDSYQLGNVITLKDGGGETPKALNISDFTIVGVIRSPLYLSFERGNTNIGSGKLGTYIVIPEEAFNINYYTELSVKLKGSDNYAPFSDEYDAFAEDGRRLIEDASPTLIAARVNDMRPVLQKEISEAEQEIAAGESEVNDALKQIDDAIAQLQPLAENGQNILAAAEQQFQEQFALVDNQISNSSAAYQQAVQSYYEQKQQLTAKQTEYDEKQQQLQESKQAYDSLYAQYTDATNKVESTKQSIKYTNSLIDAASDMMGRIGDTQANAYSNEQMQSFVSIMQVMYPDLYNSVRSLTTSGLASEIVANVSPYLESQKAELAKEEADLAKYSELLAALGTRLSTEQKRLEDATNESQAAYKALQQASLALDQMNQQLQQMGYDIQAGSVDAAIEKMKAEQKLNELRVQIQSAPSQLAEVQNRRSQLLAQSDSTLAYARTQLAEAKELYAELGNVQWNIFDRNDTPGYTGYGQAVKNIKVLSNIFPIFFFLISSLVCLTTVTRMVEEDRTLLGTYKALGFDNRAIMKKYTLYSLSACVFGSFIGITVGIFLFPYAINAAYSIMYSLPKMAFRFPAVYAALGFLIALLSTAVVTHIAVNRDLRLTPAVLMRPKAPKKGKRIFLERFTGFWSHLSFTAKVTARNLFRNKSRFSMTLVGIAGCTAMLLASLGFYNSISAIKAEQFDNADAIAKYDLQVVFDRAQTSPNHTAEYNTASSDGRISDMCLISLSSMTGFSDRTDTKLDVYVMVPETPGKLPLFVDLRDRKTHEEIELNNSGAVITEKLAKDTDTKVGDDISFSDASGHTYTVSVSAIAENYTFHYIYLTPALYNAVTGGAPTYSYAIGNISPSLKEGQVDMESLKGLLAGDLMRIDGVTTVAYLSETTKSIGEITKALSAVILVFFFSALILAFVVLYNLANINIIERTRELATLKVLGFNDTEINRYILRENVVVSLFGILFGIGFGLVLHRLLITFTAIDTVMYGQRIYWYSYVIAIGITILFIAGVNLLLHRKTARIDMVESLKSVE